MSKKVSSHYQAPLCFVRNWFGDEGLKFNAENNAFNIVPSFKRFRCPATAGRTIALIKKSQQRDNKIALSVFQQFSFLNFINFMNLITL
jgi:hypothetical protein